jgi:DNA mismatch endonuclease, patch repair protein
VPDNLTAEQRRRCMSRVRNKDTDIERAVRSELHRRGLRFRKHVQNLPGRPDIVFPRSRVAVFVDGDFWHGYDFDERRDSLSEFWRLKIESNIARDCRNDEALTQDGWRVIRLWKHEIKRDLVTCVDRVEAVLALQNGASRS